MVLLLRGPYSGNSELAGSERENFAKKEELTTDLIELTTELTLDISCAHFKLKQRQRLLGGLIKDEVDPTEQIGFGGK